MSSCGARRGTTQRRGVHRAKGRVWREKHVWLEVTLRFRYFVSMTAKRRLWLILLTLISAVLLPLALLIWYLTGYASVTTLSVGLLTSTRKTSAPAAARPAAPAAAQGPTKRRAKP